MNLTEIWGQVVAPVLGAAVSVGCTGGAAYLLWTALRDALTKERNVLASSQNDPGQLRDVSQSGAAEPKPRQ